MQTQLRKQLALDLQKKSKHQSSVTTIQEKEDGALFKHISDSLIIDHLKRGLYDYTLSVFVSESCTLLDQTIPLLDILDLLHIQRSSPLFDALSNTCAYSGEKKGFLWTFLSTIANHHQAPSHMKEISTQTTETPNIFTLDQKLHGIEKNELDKVKNCLRGEYECIEEKLLSFQRRYESRKQEELESQIERLKSTEIANMRIEERDKCQKELLCMKTEYENMYRGKLQQLEHREALMKEQASQREKDLERDLYEQRQRAMEELNNANQLKMEVQREQQSGKAWLESEVKRLETREGELNGKERSIQELEEYYENKIKQEKLRLKVEYQEKELEKGRAMNSREQELKDQIANFESQKHVYLQWKDEANRIGKDNEYLRGVVEKSKHSHQYLKEKLDIVSQQCVHMADYEEIKHKKISLEKDLEACRNSLTELNVRSSEYKEEQQQSGLRGLNIGKMLITWV